MLIFILRPEVGCQCHLKKKKKTDLNCPSRALAFVSLQKYRSSLRCETLALSCFSRIDEAPEGFSVAAGQYILYGEPG